MSRANREGKAEQRPLGGLATIAAIGLNAVNKRSPDAGAAGARP